MIPKIIHYCWFGRGEYSPLIQKCLKTWTEHLPDYQIKIWNEDTFDIHSCNWTEQAYKARKYAFVSDYVRLRALHEYGGIYLDTDIKVIKSFNDLLAQDAFMCFEDAKGDIIASCVIGSIPRHPFIKKCMEYYNQDFSISKIVDGNEANVIHITRQLQEYGLQLGGKEQTVIGIHIYPRTYFVPMDFFSNWDKTSNTYCIHLFSGSWLPDDKQKQLARRKTLWWRVLKYIYTKIKKLLSSKHD